MPTPRVRIRGGESAALQVSLPGYNVEVCALNNMAFDARFANMTVFVRDAVFFPELYEQNGDQDVVYYYPEVLARPPLCFGGVEFLSGQLPRPPSTGRSSFFYTDTQDEAYSGIIALVGAATVTFRRTSWRRRESDNFFPPSIVNFMLLRP